VTDGMARPAQWARLGTQVAGSAFLGALIASATEVLWARIHDSVVQGCGDDCLNLWPLWAYPAVPVGIVVGAVVLALWPGFGLLRAAAVSAVGMVIGVIASRLYAAVVFGTPRPGWWLAVPVGMLCYVLATVLVASVPDWRPRAAVATLCVLAVVFTVVQAPRTRHRAEVAALAGLTVPLMTLDPASGYRLAHVTVYPPEDAVMLGIRPAGAGGPHDPDTVVILLVPVPAGFAPPGVCGPEAGYFADLFVSHHPLLSGPCQSEGTDRWSRQDAAGRWHVWLRAGSKLTALDGPADPSTMYALAAALHPTTPAQLVAQAPVLLWNGDPNRR
jgi:hypothetical protein